ncbi:MAG: zinc transporter ZntB [Planctomycetes bacterium]|nr:zinc transporter ZntB [Planctomycetota bacterium]
MSDSTKQVFRVGLDGSGGIAASPETGVARWTHYRLEEDAAEWLAEERRIPIAAAEALLVGNARPRVSRVGDGLLVVLRGVNFNPGADPEDMVSMRAWVQADRVVTVSPRRVLAVEDVHAELGCGEGPRDPGEILTAVAATLVERMRPIVDGLEEEADGLYERLLHDGPDGLQRELGELRHTIALLRRHMAPQRDALAQLHRSRTEQLSEASLDELTHVADRQLRYVEDLDALRERATVLQDELNNAVANTLNRNMYVLSIVAAVFLPLGLLTGLLGINVGGMPGIDSPLAFWIVCGALVVLAAIEVVFLRRWKMI